VSGTWTANPATGMVNAAGNPSYTAKPGYLLPGRPEGCLVGRVGQGAPFYVGLSASAPAGETGPLSLAINDDVTDRYGVGYADNRGAVTVEITRTPGGQP
jgi:glucose dehydrogenase